MLLLLGILGGSAWNVSRLAAHGRGGYGEAVRFLGERSSGDVVTVGSDHDFRNSRLLRFYADELPSNRSLVYFSRDKYPPSGPEWIIVHRLEEIATVPDGIRDNAGNRYRLARSFPFAALSGCHWFLYHNANQD